MAAVEDTTSKLANKSSPDTCVSVHDLLVKHFAKDSVNRKILEEGKMLLQDLSSPEIKFKVLRDTFHNATLEGAEDVGDFLASYLSFDGQEDVPSFVSRYKTSLRQCNEAVLRLDLNFLDEKQHTYAAYFGCIAVIEREGKYDIDYVLHESRLSVAVLSELSHKLRFSLTKGIFRLEALKYLRGEGIVTDIKYVDDEDHDEQKQ